MLTRHEAWERLNEAVIAYAAAENEDMTGVDDPLVRVGVDWVVSWGAGNGMLTDSSRRFPGGYACSSSRPWEALGLCRNTAQLLAGLEVGA